MKKLSVLLMMLQANAFADSTIKVTPTSQTFEVSGTASNTNSPIGGSPDDMVLTAKREKITTDSYDVIVYACENIDTNTDGKKGDWKDFYIVPKSQKNAAIANAILGVSSKSAPYVAAQLMDVKPRSWKSFAAAINAAAKEMKQDGRDTQWVRQVLVNHKKENMENLGYVASGADCSVSTKTITDTDREDMPPLTALVKLNISGLKLLPGESERVTVSFDGTSVTASNSNTFNNISKKVNLSDFGSRYDASARVEFNGAGRKQVTPDTIVDRNSNFSSNGALSLSHQALSTLMANSEFAASCQAVVNASVIATSGPAWKSKERTTGTPKVIELDMKAGSTNSSMGALSLTKDEEAYLSFTSSYKAGCPFYNTNATLQSTIGL